MNYLSCWILYSDPTEFHLINWLQDFNWVADDSLIDGWYIDTYIGDVQPGESVFVWIGENKEYTSGIYGEGKVVLSPQEFPLANREREYFTNSIMLKSVTGLYKLAVKSGRLWLGVPLLRDEMDTQDVLRSIIASNDKRRRIQPISEVACTAIVRMLRGRTNMIDIQYCRT